jgi:hypothetical protein
LIELRLIGARIDFRKNLPLLYMLSFGEIDFFERTCNLSAYRGRIQCLYRPHPFEYDRHTLALHLRGGYRHRLRNGRRWGGFWTAPSNEEPAGHSDQTHDDAELKIAGRVNFSFLRHSSPHGPKTFMRCVLVRLGLPPQPTFAG